LKIIAGTGNSTARFLSAILERTLDGFDRQAKRNSGPVVNRDAAAGGEAVCGIAASPVFSACNARYDPADALKIGFGASIEKASLPDKSAHLRILARANLDSKQPAWSQQWAAH